MRSPEPPARFKKTVSLQQILNYVDKPYNDICAEFEKWPLLEVRQACLRNLRECSVNSVWLADWAETCIKELAWYRDKMAEEVLSWYIFAPECHYENNYFAVRAVEFAIAMEEYMGLNFISKIVCGRIYQRPFLYSLVSSLPTLLDKLLNEIRPYDHGQKKEYVDFSWHCAERALKMIMAGKDYSFLPKIEELIVSLQNYIIYPSSFEPPYAKDLHLAMLKSTRRILKQAQREALKNPEN